ncbi:hypothetical protein K431DRAFT_227182 [Polychaeton citri CBS 116435]|uniref:Zn(2)-C6 fungal-type domain-containing protein n=1 Tax=Polychaeton citri CBS 116435 TaxID=1314669 RepID=A0A9P4Q3W0_9PEZI|nr:hypothetical protein K431DRAFT_227182 [Polychaeton citri CBS 116435]
MPAPKTGRNRSLGGCSTCRRHHVKCDETRPTCKTCSHAGRTCGGYKIRISFDVGDDSQDVGVGSRRPLFTEAEQRGLSRDLIASLQQRHITQVLSQIDERCEKDFVLGSSFDDVRQGPFCVFGAKAFPSTDDDTVIVKANLSPDIVESSPETIERNDLAMPVDHSFETLFEDALADGPFSRSPVGFDFTGTAALDTSLEALMGQPFPFDCIDIDQADWQRRFTPLSSPVPSSHAASSRLTEDACLLLSHYKDDVIYNFSPLRSDRKSPWHTLHLSTSMNTLAALTLNDKPNCGSLSVFYAILAMSAYSLRNSSTNHAFGHWSSRAEKYRELAQHNLKSALSSLTQPKKTAKYKDILMSQLTMMNVLMFAGDDGHIEHYLLDAEKFIRLRGLVKREKSRKIRLLHHCYAYLRILNESTLVSSRRLRISIPRMMTGAEHTSTEKGDEFRLSQWKEGLNARMLELKTREQGENDLHLAVPGRWDSTLYPHIFGIPESLLSLMSLVVRLANEKQEGSLSLSDFSKRAKDLETCILNWDVPVQNAMTGEREAFNQDHQSNPVEHMLGALHSALHIYFYRRIHDVSAEMLQDKARQTLESLERCEQEDRAKITYSASFLWPAFIAASEALSTDLQSSFSAWFERASTCSSLKNIPRAHSILQHLWLQRLKYPTIPLSWCEYFRDYDVRLYFS